MNRIARWWGHVQALLFEGVAAGLDERLTERHQQVMAVLEVVRVEQHVPMRVRLWTGRPAYDRRPLARAFVAKAVYNDPTTVGFLERLRTDRNLCRICGWDHPGEVPSEATFSRAFSEFAEIGLGDTVHQALVKQHLGDGKVLVGHIARDSTEIDARERAVKKPKPPPQPKRKRGRPRKGEEGPPKPPRRVVLQLGQTPEEALVELPTACDWGSKKNSQGMKHSWKGYKLHLDVCCAGLPLNAVTTSASLHDSQVAIPMARRTAQRVTALYEVMDSAYVAKEISQACEALGHVPIVELHSSEKKMGISLEPARERRLDERTVVERAYGRLKDSFGARFVRVRGHAKVHLHLMFGVLALFADQLIKLALDASQT